MNTTSIGTDFEKRVYTLFSQLLNNDELSFAPHKYSQIHLHKKYNCLGSNREIDFDITIETHNPNSQSAEWSSLVVIECKCLSHRVNISDLDEFETKMKKVSTSGIKGVMVTNIGFSTTEIEQAKNSHIALMVLSEEKYNWIVSREINKHDQQMNILRGNERPGLVPTIYIDGYFTSLYDFLKSVDVSTSDEYLVNLPWLEQEVIKEKAKELYQSCNISSRDIAGDILAQQYPDFCITFSDSTKGILT